MQQKLFGLVLAGGKSQRMKQDKGLINYHGKPQREYLYDLLDEFCEEVYFSCRKEQVKELSDFRTIPDAFDNLGPLGGILSAFRQNQHVAWLVVACDLPLLDKAVIEELISQQNPSKIATAFRNSTMDFPEPLIAIWQPQSYPLLLQFFQKGYLSPRKILMSLEIELIEPTRPETLMNVNRPEEYEVVMKMINEDNKVPNT